MIKFKTKMRKTVFIVIGIVLFLVAACEIHYGRRLKLEKKRIATLREELRREAKSYRYDKEGLGGETYRFLKEGQYDRAIIWLNYMNDVFENSFQTLLGDVYLCKNEPRLALDHYADARKRNDSIGDFRNTFILTKMATAYAMLGEHEQAVKLYCERLLYLETSGEFREDYMPGDFDPPPKHIKSPKELSAYLSEHGSKYEKKETLERVLRFLASMPDRLEIKE